MPIRVLQVLGGLEAGGAESFVMNLYRKIDKSKVQFDFVKHITHKGVFEDEIHQMGGKVYQCPRYTGKNHFAYCKWWNNFFEEHPEYHVIHGHVRSTAAIYLKIANNHGLVTIAHSHSTSNGSGVSAMVKDLMQLPIRNTADYLFACSDRAGEWLFGKKATKKPNYQMIPNGIDLSRFAFDEKKRFQMRKELFIDETALVLGHVGRMTEPKNHKFLLQLFAKYHSENPNSKLLLVGDGELYEEVKQQCKQLKIADDTIMVGSKTNTEDYYQAMDAFLFPSLWEGLGIVAIEAQANGLPCLVSENIPREALVEESVKVLDLRASDEWLLELSKISAGNRRLIDEKLRPYDVSIVAIRLQKFYLEHEKVK